MARRLLLAAVFLACSGTVFWFALVHTVHRGTLAVPDLGGQNLEQARQRAHDLGLELAVEEPGVFSTVVDVGSIAYQEPPAGFHVKAGSSITVRVSLGGERLLVPDVRGASLTSAQREIEHIGLSTGVRARVEGQGAADRVIATGPPSGQTVPPQAAVNLLVNASPGTPTWVMPSLISQRLSDAEGFCRRNRLRLGRAREVDYPGFPAGVVLRQYPGAGAPVEASDIITLWVSR